jgi:hypothetical protein
MDAAITASPPPPLPEIHRFVSARHPLIAQAFDCWNARLKGRAMPSRADFNPKEMLDLLPHMALLEPRIRENGTKDYFVRLAGTQIEQTYGPVGNKFVGDFIAPEFARIWCLAFDGAVRAKEPIGSLGRMVFERRTWLEVEIFVAPMSNDGETVSMLFVVVATWPAGKPPA